jgi:hypothetical protein
VPASDWTGAINLERCRIAVGSDGKIGNLGKRILKAAKEDSMIFVLFTGKPPIYY